MPSRLLSDALHGSYPGSEPIKAVYNKIDKLAETIDPDKPWAHVDAARLDGMTFAEWHGLSAENDNVRALTGDIVASIACAIVGRAVWNSVQPRD